MKKFDQILNNSKSSKWTKNEQSYSSEMSIFDFIILIKNWKSVVGDMLAANSIPLKINHGTLTIITKHSAISNELNFMSSAIKNNIVKAFPQLKSEIERINFQNSPLIFEQMKEDERKYEETKLKQKNLNHPFSPEYRARLSEAKEFFKETFEANNSENPIDPELENLLLSLKIQKDRTS